MRYIHVLGSMTMRFCVTSHICVWLKMNLLYSDDNLNDNHCIFSMTIRQPSSPRFHCDLMMRWRTQAPSHLLWYIVNSMDVCLQESHNLVPRKLWYPYMPPSKEANTKVSSYSSMVHVCAYMYICVSVCECARTCIHVHYMCIQRQESNFFLGCCLLSVFIETRSLTSLVLTGHFF